MACIWLDEGLAILLYLKWRQDLGFDHDPATLWGSRTAPGLRKGHFKEKPKTPGSNLARVAEAQRRPDRCETRGPPNKL